MSFNHSHIHVVSSGFLLSNARKLVENVYSFPGKENVTSPLLIANFIETCK